MQKATVNAGFQLSLSEGELLSHPQGQGVGSRVLSLPAAFCAAFLLSELIFFVAGVVFFLFQNPPAQSGGFMLLCQAQVSSWAS